MYFQVADIFKGTHGRQIHRRRENNYPALRETLKETVHPPPTEHHAPSDLVFSHFEARGIYIQCWCTKTTRLRYFSNRWLLTKRCLVKNVRWNVTESLRYGTRCSRGMCATKMVLFISCNAATNVPTQNYLSPCLLWNIGSVTGEMSV